MNSVNEEKNLSGEGSESPHTPLSERELDAAVAEKVMGWRLTWLDRSYHSAGEGWSQRPVDSKSECRHDPIAYWTDAKDRSLNEVSEWEPSSDISDAVEVVEKMREQGWSFACTLYEGKLPYASFCKRTAASSRNAEASTLPEAICRAALEAVKKSTEIAVSDAL